MLGPNTGTIGHRLSARQQLLTRVAWEAQTPLRSHLHSHLHSRQRLYPVAALTQSSTIVEPTRMQAIAIGSRVSARHVRRRVDSVAQALRRHQSRLRLHPGAALTPSSTIVEPTRAQAT